MGRRDPGLPVPNVAGRGFEFDPALKEIDPITGQAGPPRAMAAAVPPSKFEQAMALLTNPAVLQGAAAGQNQVRGQTPVPGIRTDFMVRPEPFQAPSVSFGGGGGDLFTQLLREALGGR